MGHEMSERIVRAVSVVLGSFGHLLMFSALLRMPGQQESVILLSAFVIAIGVMIVASCYIMADAIVRLFMVFSE